MYPGSSAYKSRITGMFFKDRNIISINKNDWVEGGGQGVPSKKKGGQGVHAKLDNTI